MHAADSADSKLPTGTVTILFTDLEGSTALWEQHPVAMQAALARHDRLLRHAIGSFGGCIVKRTGDGVLAVFVAAADALAACVAAQRALQAPEVDASNAVPAAADALLPMSLKVRMGEFAQLTTTGISLLVLPSQFMRRPS